MDLVTKEAAMILLFNLQQVIYSEKNWPKFIDGQYLTIQNSSMVHNRYKQVETLYALALLAAVVVTTLGLANYAYRDQTSLLHLSRVLRHVYVQTRGDISRKKTHLPLNKHMKKIITTHPPFFWNSPFTFKFRSSCSSFQNSVKCSCIICMYIYKKFCLI